jgi:hypothetical protein
MLRYQSRRHRYLMHESEQALADAAEGDNRRNRRIAKHILSDAPTYRLWESRHADLVLPVAEHSRRSPQIFELRDIEVRLLHRRALIRHIRKHGIVGQERDRLFSVFYGPLETQNAILAEHRQYTLAVSSRLSTDHLINVMRDPVSWGLLRHYEAVYTEYFELYCYMVACEDAATVEATKPVMLDLRQRAMRMIRQIHTERPDNRHSSFDRQADLARSGRYPIRNYMVG